MSDSAIPTLYTVASFKSKRECRRHIKIRNPWYFYFDAIPLVKDDIIMSARQAVNPGVHSKTQPSFSIEVGVCKDFEHWLHTFAVVEKAQERQCSRQRGR